MVSWRRCKWIAATFIGLTVAGVMAGCSAPDSGSLLVEYHRQGGIAGFDDRLVIQSDRQATLEQRSGKRSLDLDPEVVGRLLEQLEQIDFAALEPEYLPQGTGADLIEYEVTYKGHTVRTMDTAVPETLQPLLALLDEIIQSTPSS